MGLLQGLMSKLGGAGMAGGGGMGGGMGGLLGGLGDKLGGFINGTGAEFSSQPRPDIDGGEGIGPIQQMPQMTQTKAAQPGLLERMKTPDARGLTFGDKLFAAGSVMQGDSGGAATYLSNQRAAADQLSERTRGRDLAAQGLDALRGAIDPATGQLNVQKYLASLPAGADMSEGLKVREALQPRRTSMSGPGGGIYSVDQDAPGGPKATELIAGRPAAPSLFNPDGTLNMEFITGRGKLKDAEAAATAAHRAPRVGRPGGSPTTGRPAGY